MAVPRIFATQPAGNVPASYLDEDFAFVLSSAGVGSIARIKLAGNLTVWVRTDALSDAPTAFADTAAGAFQTWQAAVDVVLAYDFNDQNVFIKAGEEGSPKTWDLSGSAINIPTITGGGALYFQPSSSGTTITNTGAPVFFLTGTLRPVFLGAIKIRSGGSGHGLVETSQQSLLQLDPAGGPDFGADDFCHIYVHDGQAQAALLNTSYTISGSAPYHIYVTSSGNCSCEGNTITISAPINVTAFVRSSNNAYIQSTLCTFVNPGNVTGSKYGADNGGVINTLGNGADYFPGTVAGVSSNLGIYEDTWATSLFVLPAGFYSQADSQIQKSNPTFLLSKANSGEASTFAGVLNGVARWLVQPGDATAESGGNAGSDLPIFAFDDGGGFIGTALKLIRATMEAVFGGDVTVNSGRVKTGKYFASTIPTDVTGATYSVADTDNTIAANRAGTVTLTLPAVASYVGRRLRVLTYQSQTVVSATSNVIPLVGGSAAAGILSATAGKWADLDCDGANWRITASN